MNTKCFWWDPLTGCHGTQETDRCKRKVIHIQIRTDVFQRGNRRLSKVEAKQMSSFRRMQNIWRDSNPTVYVFYCDVIKFMIIFRLHYRTLHYTTTARITYP